MHNAPQKQEARRTNEVLVPSTYPKIKRFPIRFSQKIRKDKIMSREDAEAMLAGEVVLEEKMDGKNTKHTGDKFIIFGEDLLRVHSIRYKVPARFAVFDIFDTTTNLFLPRSEKEMVFDSIRRGVVKVDGRSPNDFFLVCLISRGRFTMEELQRQITASTYAFDPRTGKQAFMEGVVVKSNRSLFLVEFDKYVGKIVRSEFTEGITTHYLDKPIEQNQINPAFR